MIIPYPRPYYIRRLLQSTTTSSSIGNRNSRRYCYCCLSTGTVRNVLDPIISMMKQQSNSITHQPWWYRSIIPAVNKTYYYRSFGVVIHGSNDTVIKSTTTNTTDNISNNEQSDTNRKGQQQSKNKNNCMYTSVSSSFHFASTDYTTSFVQNTSLLLQQQSNQSNNNNLNDLSLRKKALKYINETYDSSLWFNDPIVSLLNGEKLMDDPTTTSGEATIVVDTCNAMGDVNGKQILANPTQIAMIQSHIQSYQYQYRTIALKSTSDDTSSSSTSTSPLDIYDLRKPVRYVEDILFNRHVGYLIGNQCIDFCKQDGITEIEEAIQVNTIERQYNDMLIQQEQNHIVHINRQPIYISTVSNFTNFLDLCRKALRSLEVGIPIVVLCRSSQYVTQHSYRWVQLLIDLCLDVGIDAGMITYISASLPNLHHILQVCEHSTGNLYATCSRNVAADIMNIYPKTIASTGGPNTLICTKWDDTTSIGTMSKTAQAIADSATIESAGQCTALRHCIVPTSMSDTDCSNILLNNITTIDSAPIALLESLYAGVLTKTKTNEQQQQQEQPTDDYQRLDTKQRHQNVDIYIKINNNHELPKDDIQEYWRKVVIDFTKLDLLQNKFITQGKIKIRPINEIALQQLVSWLNHHQPISLAVNGPRHEAIMVGIKIWEHTSLVVNTIGSTDNLDMLPAMTCQARPQDGECFGEFPPRNDIHKYTLFPVIIPSSNPSYDTVYDNEYLQLRGKNLSEYIIKSTKAILNAITDDTVRGYCILLIEYLQNSCRKNPKSGFSRTRSVLYGLQRPPLGMQTILRCTNHSKFDDLAIIYILFQVTNARDQVEISVHPNNVHIQDICQQLNLSFTIESDIDYTNLISNRTDIFHHVTITEPNQSRFPMVGNFVSLYFPIGHIKSTMMNDHEFEMKARISEKWLNTLF